MGDTICANLDKFTFALDFDADAVNVEECMCVYIYSFSVMQLKMWIINHLWHWPENTSQHCLIQPSVSIVNFEGNNGPKNGTALCK